ncbi:MAG: hypothetical protein ACE5GB_02130 [Acidimicrobiales bacterium]
MPCSGWSTTASGTTATTCAPEQPVTRGQLATFLYRYSGKPAVALDPSSPRCEATGGASDEFDSGAVDLRGGGSGAWTLENGHLAELAGIDLSIAGKLLIVPTQSFHNGWFRTANGVYVHRPIEGDLAAIRIRVVSADSPGAGATPGPGYSGGLLVRDAADGDDWVMYNMGDQAPGFGYGRELKTTLDASSVLELHPQVETTHRLLVCRVGSEFHHFHRSAAGTEWTEEVRSHDRPDIGAAVDAGIVANAWQGGPRPWIEVDAIHFGIPTSLADCNSSVAPV